MQVKHDEWQSVQIWLELLLKNAPKQFKTH